MTEEELAVVLSRCPTLYHMAEQDSWPSIQARGLLSTAALLDTFDIQADERSKIEAQRRSSSIHVGDDVRGRAVIRDQLPMDDKGLRRCLLDGLSPEDWYKIINAKVFFWLSRERLLKLLNAGAYRKQEHDVLELDATELVAVYRDRIWLSPINSGCTKPFPTPRGLQTFTRINDYPYSSHKYRPRRDRVVELAVDYAVPNVANFVTRVVRMKGDEELAIIYSRS